MSSEFGPSAETQERANVVSAWSPRSFATLLHSSADGTTDGLRTDLCSGLSDDRAMVIRSWWHDAIGFAVSSARFPLYRLGGAEKMAGTCFWCDGAASTVARASRRGGEFSLVRERGVGARIDATKPEFVVTGASGLRSSPQLELCEAESGQICAPDLRIFFPTAVFDLTGPPELAPSMNLKVARASTRTRGPENGQHLRAAARRGRLPRALRDARAPAHGGGPRDGHAHARERPPHAEVVPRRGL